MENVMHILSDRWVEVITALVTVCAAISVVLPVPSGNGNKIYRAIYRLIQWIALNLGKAKNSGDIGTSGKTDEK